MILALSATVHPARSEGAFYGGVNYSSAFHPKDFRISWSDGMGYSAGLEQRITERLGIALDLSFSRFIPDAHVFSDGGRKIVIGGDITSFLVSANLKACLSRTIRRAKPFAQAGMGLARFSISPMDLVDFVEGMMTSYFGASETRAAFRAGGGVLVQGPPGSSLDVQFDAYGTWLVGPEPTLYGSARMLVLFKVM